MISAMGVAPRSSAWASDSTTTTPAPSPSTNPSRVRSNGRDAVSGESLRFESAVMFAEGRDAHRHDRRLRAAGEDDVALAGSG